MIDRQMEPPATAPLADQARIAQEVQWTYRSLADEADDRDFYTALSGPIVALLGQRIAPGERVWVGREVRLQVGQYMVQARLTQIDPVLASAISSRTRITAQYQPRAADAGQDSSAFIAEIIRYPNEDLGLAFDALVGLDRIKEDLFRKLTLLISPRYLSTWSATYYADHPPAALMHALQDRYPLLILEGDVGSGKTALARSIGDRLATRLHTDVALYVVNAQVRGGGHVGELTQNIARAFAEAERCQEREQIPVMLLIDEADALAQARGSTQTHHEDDAGVNTLIQQIDRLRGKEMAVLFATNLMQSLDAAILRRSLITYHFDRPDPEQRGEVFRRLLAGTVIEETQIAALVAATEPRQIAGLGERAHRYTYSDLTQRIIPRAVETAVYEQRPLEPRDLISACEVISPTPEMRR